MKVVLDSVKNIISNPYHNSFNNYYKPSNMPCDRVEISKESRSIMEDVSALRLDKVENVRHLINKGNYNISSIDIAQKIIRNVQLYNRFNSEKE